MRKAALVVILAALARIIILANSSGDAVLFGDGHHYRNIVENMLDGRGMVVDTFTLGSWRALFPPLYPFLLYLFSSAFGLSTASVTAFNFACDLGTAGAIIWLARSNNVERAGWWAAAAWLLWPTSIFLSPVAAKEPLVACLVVLNLCALLKALEQPRWAIGFGAFAGLLALTQPALAPLPAVCALFLYRRGDWRRSMLVAAASACLVMSPWWIRNYLIFGQFVPLTTSGGFGLWMAAVPWGNGGFIPLPKHLLVEPSTAAWTEAMSYIGTDPLGYLTRCVEKTALAFNGDWQALKSMRFRGMELVALPIVALPILLFGAGAAALVLTRSTLTRLICGCLASLLAFQFWFEFGERHRYFLTPLLLLAVTHRYSMISISNQDRAASIVIEASLST